MKAQWLSFRNRLGWQGMLGIALLAVAYLFYSVVLEPVEQRARWARAKADTSSRNMILKARMQDAELKSPAVMLERFYAFFATDQAVTDNLAKIYSLAEGNGLVLRHGEYKLQNEKNGRLAQYQIVLPVRGGYLQIRTFAAQVLNKIPTASLDQIRFERKRTGEQNVEAEIKFTLYMVQT